jgi:hypothetical protein
MPTWSLLNTATQAPVGCHNRQASIPVEARRPELGSNKRLVTG